MPHTRQTRVRMSYRLVPFPSVTRVRDGEPGAPPPPPPPAAPPLPQTPEELERVIEMRLTRERAASRAELERLRQTSGSSAEERAELERLRQAETERARKELEAQGQYAASLRSVKDEFEQERKRQQEANEALLAELRQTRCHDSLVVAATEAGAINPQQVAKLLDGQVKLNDQRQVVILDENGQPAMRRGDPIKMGDLLEKFAVDNPHLFKANPGTPAGAAGGASTNSSAPADGLDAQIAAAKAAYDAAHTRASQTTSDGDVIAARKARREYEALLAKKKQGASAS